MMRLIIALLLSGITVAASAQEREQPPNLDATIITVQESAQAEIERDLLTLRMRAEVKGNSAQEVQNHINGKMKAALDAVRDTNQSADKPVKFRTQGYYVANQDDYQNGAWTHSHWVGRQDIVVSGGDFPTILEIATKLSDGLVMTGMDYGISPEAMRAHEDALTTEVVHRVMDKAKLIADAMDMEVERILTLKPQTTPSYVMAPRAALAAAKESAPVQGEAGTGTVNMIYNATVLLQGKEND